MLTRKEFIEKFLSEDGMGAGVVSGGIANTTQNVQGLETIPLVTKKRQRKLLRRKPKTE